MQESKCPECGAAVGGGSHQLVAGNRPARDLAAMQENFQQH